jgi:type III pantothenate kinase
MLIAIDVGNTQTVVGLFNAAELVDRWRLSTVAARTTDEYRLLFEGMLHRGGWRMEEIDGVALSSVVPPVKEALVDLAGGLVGSSLVVVGPGVRTGLSIQIDNPREVGADRVVNSVAAVHKYGAPVVSVDFGTSTNFDVVDEGGAYIGGVIAAGLHVSEAALISATAALRRVEIRLPRSSIGKNTAEAMQSGLLYGHAGMVDGIVERIWADLGSHAPVVATGGLAPTIVPLCRNVKVVDDRLTLDGLRLVYEMNSGE